MLKSMAAGVMLGAAATILILPQLDRKTQRVVRNTGKRMGCMAGDAYDSLLGYMR